MMNQPGPSGVNPPDFSTNLASGTGIDRPYRTACAPALQLIAQAHRLRRHVPELLVAERNRLADGTGAPVDRARPLHQQRRLQRLVEVMAVDDLAVVLHEA